jgi:CO/xanthine dehydrogenase Mo-binding subunit
VTAVTAPPLAQPFTDPELRLDGRLKVTGAARYLADRTPADTLWMAATRSPYPHARVVAVSTAAALALPGVRAVLTGRDVEGIRFGRRLQDWPILASDRVRFIGDRVAAVAADTPAEAAAAAAAVEVDYEELPAILDADQATVPGAPILHPDAAGYAYLGGRRPPVAHPNVQGHTLAIKGDRDIEAVLRGAHRVFEHRFTTQRQHQGHLEPHGASAWLEADGTVHVLTTNKSPFSLRNQLATAFGMALQQIEVENPVIGGDFGGKGLSLDDALCVVLARATGRPVSAVMSYADELQAANPRHGARMRLRTGVDRSGRIVGHAADFRLDGGAYAAAKPMPDLTPPGPLACLSAYDIEHVRVEVTVYYTNTVPAGHMRSPGEVQAAFAGESHIDCIARELGEDPLAFRRRHAAGMGATDVVGRQIRDPRAVELLDLVEADRAARRAASPGHGAQEVGSWRRGRGVSLTARHMEGGRMTVRLRAHADGTIEIRTGVPDQGGGAHTMMARVAASTLGLPVGRFRVTLETTANATADLGVGASRVTYIGSRATEAAADALRHEVLRLGAASGGEAPAALSGGLLVRHDGSSVATYDEVMAGIDGDWLDVEGTFDSEAHHDEAQDFNVAAYDIEVEVDERTGVVRVVDAFLAGDVGTVINPIAHEGQVQGGFAFGIGAALLEELDFDDGRIANVHLGDYKLPTTLDVPPLRTRYLHADGRGAFGAKMAGELSVSGVTPAIANAVADAVGARVTTMPLSPERVLEALAAARATAEAAT